MPLACCSCANVVQATAPPTSSLTQSDEAAVSIQSMTPQSCTLALRSCNKYGGKARVKVCKGAAMSGADEEGVPSSTIHTRAIPAGVARPRPCDYQMHKMSSISNKISDYRSPTDDVR